jgi:hypothetical protein
MDYVPLVREVGSVFSVPNGPTTASDSAVLMRSIMRWTYTILAVVLVLGGSYYLFTKMERPITGVLYFIGATIAAYFYWVKWFMIPAMKPDWPPFQTICPDYLTPVSPGMMKDANGNATTGGSLKCVDFVGVSTNGVLKKADPAMLDKQINQTQYAFTVDPKMKRDELKAQVDTYGLTWQTMFTEK